MNNRRRSQMSLKVKDELFEKENGESHERSCKCLFETCRKEQTSVKKVFFVLFSFYFLLLYLPHRTCLAVIYSHKSRIEK